MSKPGEPVVVTAGPAAGLPVFRQLVLNWLLAHHHGVELVVEAPPPVLEGLDWLAVPHRRGSVPSTRARVAAPWDRRPGDLEVGDFVTSVTLDELRQEGFLSEVVLGALAQCGWRRSPDAPWAHLTRGELLIRFSPEGLLNHAVAFDPEAWREYNRARLRELSPRELVEALRPWLPVGKREPLELEAAVLLTVDEVDNLVELAQRLT